MNALYKRNHTQTHTQKNPHHVLVELLGEVVDAQLRVGDVLLLEGDPRGLCLVGGERHLEVLLVVDAGGAEVRLQLEAERGAVGLDLGAAEHVEDHRGVGDAVPLGAELGLGGHDGAGLPGK